jgi:hypothetical protein
MSVGLNFSGHGRPDVAAAVQVQVRLRMSHAALLSEALAQIGPYSFGCPGPRAQKPGCTPHGSCTEQLPPAHPASQEHLGGWPVPWPLHGARGAGGGGAGESHSQVTSSLRQAAGVAQAAHTDLYAGGVPGFTAQCAPCAGGGVQMPVDSPWHSQTAEQLV